MISVIVPVYGVEAYLDRCVKSVLSQTYGDLEIILVDDGSPDRCGEMCDRWAAHDPRIRAVHQTNTGSAGARNTGLDIYTGEYICFVDSDDEIDLKMIEILYEAVQNGRYDLAICGHQRFREGEGISSFHGNASTARTLTNAELWEEIFGRLNNAVWNKLYRKDLIGSLRFLRGLIHGEDLIFNLRYIIRCENALMIDLTTVSLSYPAGTQSQNPNSTKANSMKSEPRIWHWRLPGNTSPARWKMRENIVFVPG